MALLSECLEYLIRSENSNGQRCRAAREMLAISDDRQPLTIVVYVHGWHHSAALDDADVKKFRNLLWNASAVDSDLCTIKRGNLKSAAARKSDLICFDGEKLDFPWQKKRRIVGI